MAAYRGPCAACHHHRPLAQIDPALCHECVEEGRSPDLFGWREFVWVLAAVASVATMVWVVMRGGWR